MISLVNRRKKEIKTKYGCLVSQNRVKNMVVNKPFLIHHVSNQQRVTG